MAQRMLLAAAAGVVGTLAIQVNQILANRGSLAGGTYVTLFGDGFDRAGRDGSTRVWFGNDECTTVWYDSTATKLVCYSPEHMVQEWVRVQVSFTDLYAQSLFAACPGNQCSFQYRWDRTPVASGMFSAGVAGGLWRSYGQYYGSSIDMYTVRVGAALCAFDENLYSDSTNIMSWNGYGTLRCNLGEQDPGFYNVSIRVHSLTEGYGETLKTRRVKLVNFNGVVYQFQAHPKIDTLSSYSGGLGGRSEMVISGSGFSPVATNNIVHLAGVPCTVTSATFSELRCKVGPSASSTAAFNASSRQVFAAGRGLLGRIYYNTQQSNGNELSATPGLTVMNTYGLRGYIDGDSDQYTQDLTGFLVPPVTANYSFYLRGDDWVGVYLSTDENPANARAVAWTGWSTYWHQRQRPADRQISDPIFLQAGRRYWIRVRHVEGWGEDWFDIALRVHATGNAAAASITSENQRVFSSTPEIQSLSFRTDVVREVQVIELTGAQSGQWTLQWPGQVIPNGGSLPMLSQNAADWQVRDVLQGLGGCNSVSVSRAAVVAPTNATGFRWTVTFNCPVRGFFPALSASIVSMQPQAGRSISIDAFRTVSASAPATGYFYLQLGNETTTALSPQSAAWQIEAALEALDGVTDVEVAGGFGNMWDSGSWLITFWGPYGDVPMLVPVWNTTDEGITLQGTNATMAVTEVHAGSTDPFYWPAPMEFFEAPARMPAVTVRSNGILASCDVFRFDGSANMDCSYRYDASITPTITDVSPTSVTAGDTLTVTGTNFLPATAGVGLGPGGTDIPIWQLNIIYLNDSVCNVTSATATQLECTVADAGFGTYFVDVEVGLGRNYALRSSNVSAVTYPMVLNTVSPLTGSKMGGTLITLSGTGFRSDVGSNTVTVGGAPCVGVSATFTTFTCLTPAAPTGTAAQISSSIVANGVLFGSSFVYDSALTPLIIAMTPSKLSAAITGRVNFTIRGVPAGALVTVMFGTRQCMIRGGGVRYGNNTLVTCTLVRGAALPLPQLPVVPVVSIGVLGYANASVYALDTGFRVDRMSRQVGSLEGGAELTFYGVGFSSQAFQNEVVFFHVDNWGYEWRTPCPVIAFAADGTNMTCYVPKIPAWKRGQPRLLTSRTPLQATMWLKVNNITAPCDPSTNGCSYTQNIENTPVFNTTWLSDDRRTLFVMGDNIPVPGIHTTINGWNCMPPTAVNSTTFSCPLPIGIAGTYAIDGHVHVLGNARVNATHTFLFTVSSTLSATLGSTAGGLQVIFTGEGFADDDLARNVVTFGQGQAVVVSATRTQLVVLTPPITASAATMVDVSLFVLSADYLNNNAMLTLPAAFTYDPSLAVTPTLTRVTPTSGYAGQLVVLGGAGFGNITAQHAVQIGGVPCSIIVALSNDSTILCTLGQTPAGLHRIFVSVPGEGYARVLPSTNAVRFQSLLEVTGVSQTTSGYGGGALITYIGRGFSASTLGSMRIDTCDTTCNVTTANYTHVTCLTGALITRPAITQLGLWTPGMIMGTITPASAAAAHDMAVDASFTACQVNMDLGPAERAVITGVRFYPRFRSTALMRGARFLASNDSVSWDLVYTVPFRVGEGWNNADLYDRSVDPGTLPAYRYMRFQFAGTGSSCTANEIEFRGIAVSARDDGVCNATITVDPVDTPRIFTSVVAPVAVTTPTSLAITYGLATTPFVSGIQPNNGSALGGTTVMLYGRNFPGSVAGVTVWLNGIPQTVIACTATSITIITSRRDTVNPLSVNVTVAGVGTALYDSGVTYFKYTDRWSDLTTWKYNEPPVEGDTVYIPAGQSVLVDMSPPRLFLVLIQGELIFDRQDLSFGATYIFIHGGRFEVGTEAQPFMNKLTITLYGDRYDTVEIPEVGAKCLAVMDRGGVDSHSGGHDHQHGPVDTTSSSFSRGFLEIHGAPRKRVWTKLGAAAPAGTNIIRTREDVDWQPGEEIIITSTRSVWNTERVRVASVIDARTLVIDRLLENNHEYQIYPAGQWGFADVDMRAEVALLTRNVVIQGEPEKSYRQSFGIHTGAFHGGVYHMENAEIRFCGQAGQLGRYCTHTHMVSDDFQSYVRFNSIHDSFQRITTIHATNHLLVKHNVGFNVRGHSIFVEDGVERYNVIEENLIGWTLRCPICMSSDTRPANFWTSSPTNFWRHNVAFGSASFGFWFELPGNPNGPSFTPDYCPANMPLGEFFNNTAHSSSNGLRIYPQYNPMVDGCSSASGTSPQYFYNSTFFHCGDGIFHRQAGDVHHRNHRIVENGLGFGWRLFESPNLKYSWDANIGDTLFVCDTRPNGASRCGSQAIVAPQTEWFYSSGLTLVNYGNAGALAGCHSCGSQTNFKQGGYTYRWDRLTWLNTTRRTHWNVPFKCIFWDLDGTLTGFANGTALPYWAFNNWPECPRDTVGTFAFGTVCNGSQMVRRIQIDNHNPRELDWVNLNISSDAGSQLLQFRPKEIYGWVYPAVNGHYYFNRFRSLVDWRTLRIRYAEPEYIEPGEWTGLTWTWIDYRFRNRVIYDGREVPALPVGSLPTGAHDFGTGNMPDGNKTWTVMLSTNNVTARDRYWQYTVQVANIQCPPNGCAVPPPPSLGNATLWSDVNTWPFQRLPIAGEDIVINATQYIIMDVNPPKLGRLTINGRLEFQDTGARSLQADSIVVWGELVVGTAASPFVNNAEIVLFGDRWSDAVILDNNLFLGNKMMAVLGRLSMHGRVRPVTWTRAASAISAGDTSITLTQSVQGLWSAGDRITITPTEYNISYLEDATIASVSGATVTLTAPLRFAHFAGAAAPNSPASGVMLRAAVGLLTRNVVFRGNLTSAADTYGAHMTVSVVSRPGATPAQRVRREGVVDIRYVEFRNTGKMGMEHGSVNIQYGNFLFDPSIPATNPVNVFIGNAFAFSFNYGVVCMAAKHVFVSSSVFHRNVRNSLDWDEDSTNGTVVDSMFAGNYRSPDVNADEQIPWIRPQSAIFFAAVPNRLTGNVVGGAIDAAFTIRAPDCTWDASRWSGNEAHASRIGLFILSTFSPSGCVRFDGFTAWKNAHLGIMTVDQVSNVELNNVVVADNHIGISLNFIRSAPTESYSRIRNSTVMGSSAASRASPCSESTSCLAVTENDVKGESCGSVLGSAYRRAGIMMPQYTNRGKTCERDELPVCRPVNMIERLCSLPWEKRYGTISTTNTAFYLDGVTFTDFNTTDCGRRSTAIVHNPTQIDMSVPTFMQRIRWHNTVMDARFDFSTNDQTPDTCSDGKGCDSVNNYVVTDLDGTASSSVSSTTITGPNPLNVWETPICTSMFGWNGFYCPGRKFSRAIIQNVARSNQALGGLQITRRVDPLNNATWRTSASFGSKKDSCAKRSAQPIYAHVIHPGMTHELFWPATEPDRIRYTYMSKDAADAAVIELFIARPWSWDVFVDGTKVEMKEGSNATFLDLPKLTDPAGTWVFSPQRRRIWFTIRGGNTMRNIDFVRTAAVQLTVNLAVSVEQFFGPELINNLALLLSIPPWRIKVVDVQPGSTSVAVEIKDEAPAVIISSANDTTALTAVQAQVTRLQAIAQQIQTLAGTGQMSQIGTYTVTSLAMVPPTMPVITDDATDTTTDSGTGTDTGTAAPITIVPVSRRSGLTDGQIAGAVVGSIAGVAIIAGAIVMYRRVHTTDRKRLTKASSSPRVGVDPSISGVNPAWAHGNPSTTDTRASTLVRHPSARVAWTPVNVAPATSGRTSIAQVVGGSPNVQDATNMPL